MKNHRDKVIAAQASRAKAYNAEGTFTYGEWYLCCLQYGNVCVCCGKTAELVPDHIVSLSRGGTNTIDNIQPLCIHCNAQKNIRVVDYRPGSQVNDIDGIIVPEYIDDGFEEVNLPLSTIRTIKIICAETDEKPRALIDRLALSELEKLKKATSSVVVSSSVGTKRPGPTKDDEV